MERTRCLNITHFTPQGIRRRAWLLGQAPVGADDLRQWDEKSFWEGMLNRGASAFDSCCWPFDLRMRLLNRPLVSAFLYFMPRGFRQELTFEDVFHRIVV